MSHALLKRVIWLAGIVVLLAGCSPAATPTPTPEPEPTARPTATLPAGARLANSLEDIAGTWVGLKSDRLYQRFNTDGTCYASVLLENLDTNPSVEGTCGFEGDVFLITDVKVTGLPSCGGTTGRYQVHLLANGNIIFTRVFETCAPRGRSTAMEHEPVPQQ
ncbi:MAG: hypothetical protein JSW37_06080 [Anaerolineales bacterium]|nr:MAG: hypothetical protein JSW37_06080 [Anaerolineales bacterium]